MWLYSSLDGAWGGDCVLSNLDLTVLEKCKEKQSVIIWKTAPQILPALEGEKQNMRIATILQMVIHGVKICF